MEGVDVGVGGSGVGDGGGVGVNVNVAVGGRVRVAKGGGVLMGDDVTGVGETQPHATINNMIIFRVSFRAATRRGISDTLKLDCP